MPNNELPIPIGSCEDPTTFWELNRLKNEIAEAMLKLAHDRLQELRDQLDPKHHAVLDDLIFATGVPCPQYAFPILVLESRKDGIDRDYCQIYPPMAAPQMRLAQWTKMFMTTLGKSTLTNVMTDKVLSRFVSKGPQGK